MSGQGLFVLISLVLALGTAALYWPITHHPFINFDDLQYVAENPHVTPGLNGTNFVWAFTTCEQANYHPVTWLSHQLDCTLFGVNPGAHHFVNLLYHVANTMLLFVFLRGATGAVWRSAFVAALFAWHPMHVESVAWASERKDVLSTFFWLLTLLVYLRYARGMTKSKGQGNGEANTLSSRQTCHPAVYYLLALFFCACGLLSKPMVVTLPCVLLLVDLWPLNRMAGFQFQASGSAPGGCRPVSISWLLLEKIPFFALAVAGSVATFLVQSGAGAMAKLDLGERVANAAMAYARYTAKMFWPTDLVILYPHLNHWRVALALAAVVLLAVWTISCVYHWRQAPFLMVGWFWFVGTLVPTIGLIQVGAQSIADRYTYIPSIGLFIVVTWGMAAFFSTRASGRFILPALGGAVLIGCIGATVCQIAFWSDTITLFRHAVDVTTDNYAAENVLGKAYEKAGKDNYALACYELSVKTEPRFPQSHFNLAMLLLSMGRTPEALEHLQTAAALDRGDADVQYDLGLYFSQHASWTNALNCFSNAVALRPDFARAQLAVGGAFANLGRATAAAPHLREALRLDPNLLEARTNLDRLLAEHPELR